MYFFTLKQLSQNIAWSLDRMAMLPANVVEAVEAVLKNKDGVMKKWGQIEEILLEAKLAYKQVFPPSLHGPPT